MGKRLGPGGLAVIALVTAGCARWEAPLATASRAPGDGAGRLREYIVGVEEVTRIIGRELRLPLPPRFGVRIYLGAVEYAEGLQVVAGLPEARARAVSAYSVALGRPGQVFVNDGAIRQMPRRARLAVLAHEVAHMVQYELSGGRRGRSEQWLREGMADWVAAQVLERLGEEATGRAVARARRRVGQAFGMTGDVLSVDLGRLGEPAGWEARHLAVGSAPTYDVAFLLAGELIRRRGLGAMAVYFRRFAASDDRAGHFEAAFGVSLRQFEGQALALLRDVVGEARQRLSACDAASPEARPLDEGPVACRGQDRDE